MKKNLLITLSLALTVILFSSFVLPSPVSAQSSGMCGYFMDEGYYYVNFQEYNGNSYVTAYTSGEIWAGFGFYPAEGIVWIIIHDPVFNRSGVLTGLSGYERVSGCGPGSITDTTSAGQLDLKAAKTVLSLSPECADGVTITYSDLPSDWQNAARLAAKTWADAGSGLQISGYNTASEATRSIELLDYEGNPLKWYPVGTYLRLARCEMRILLASDLHDDALASVSRNIATLDTLPAWVMPFAEPGTRFSIGSLVILNDYRFNFSTFNFIKPGVLDAQSMFTHELGHSFGLRHDTDSNAVMTGDEWNHLAQLWLGTNRRSLAPADVDQIKSLFPPAATETNTGSMDIGAYCRYKYGASAYSVLADAGDAYSWACFRESSIQPGINMDDLCRVQHPDMPYAVMGDRWNAYSWYCWSGQ